jgi:S1-C subfamily serine protease
VGDTALAIGAPFGLQGSFTAGIISGLNRSTTAPSARALTGMIQTDTPINPGNSGGPLFNLQGQVIGINTAIESPVEGSVGVGFSIPINRAKSLLPQLESGAQLAPVWLGISGQELTADVAQAQGLTVQSGVLVVEVVPNSPASNAGMQANDIITAIDGNTIATFDQLNTQISGHKAGDKVRITVVRKGRRARSRQRFRRDQRRSSDNQGCVNVKN